MHEAESARACIAGRLMRDLQCTLETLTTFRQVAPLDPEPPQRWQGSVRRSRAGSARPESNAVLRLSCSRSSRLSQATWSVHDLGFGLARASGSRSGAPGSAPPRRPTGPAGSARTAGSSPAAGTRAHGSDRRPRSPATCRQAEPAGRARRRRRMAPPAQTASAASSVQPPANTDSRASRRRSVSDSRS